MTIRRSEQAEADLEWIWLVSARQYGTSHALRVLQHLNDLFGLLERFPEMGRQHPKLRRGIRYFPVRIYPFVVFFCRQPSGIRIVRLLHDRMRAEDHL